MKAPNRDGATPLFLASLIGNASLIEKLLKAGADANEKELDGATPLMFAARNGNVAAIQVLLDHKADVNAKEAMRGTTALMWAAEQGHPEAVKILIEHGANVSTASNADTKGNKAYVAPTARQRAINDGIALDGTFTGRRGNGAARTPQAATSGRAEHKPPLPQATPLLPLPMSPQPMKPPRKPLLEERATKTAAVSLPWFTPLVRIAWSAQNSWLEHGANVNQTTKYGWTPLLTATQNRHYKLAAYLLEHGANPNILNNGGWSPLYIATDNRNIESGDYPVRKPDMDHLAYIKLLIDHGANVNVRVCGAQSTPEKCVGDNTETRTNFTMQWFYEDGATPFIRAAQSGDVVLMKLLLAHGADPKIATSNNDTALSAGGRNRVGGGRYLRMVGGSESGSGQNVPGSRPGPRNPGRGRPGRSPRGGT